MIQNIFSLLYSLVALYGLATWSLILKEEHRLRVFENRVLKGIFGPKKEEVTLGWIKVHNEELRDLCSSPSLIRIIKSMRMILGGYLARMGENKIAHRLLVRKLEGKGPLGRLRRRWVDNIKTDLVEI
jgi:hypothetical protein